MDSVYILHHYYDELDGCEEVKLIGAFSSEEEAQRVIEEYKKLPGFKYYPNDFCISEYKINVPAWTEGFITVRPRRIKFRKKQHKKR